jgi:hypothetical protein
MIFWESSPWNFAIWEARMVLAFISVPTVEGQTLKSLAPRERVVKPATLMPYGVNLVIMNGQGPKPWLKPGTGWCRSRDE